ncbi:MAG: Polyphenol oxidase [Holosporales bacterium]
MHQHMINPIIHDQFLTPHGFFTRRGGVSIGNFNSLNCGHNKGDDPENVKKNRKLVLDYIKNTYDHYKKIDLNLILAIQEHSNIPLWVEGPIPTPLPKADALVTNKQGLILGVLTADCCPILIKDHTNNLIAAIHAGWKGAILGIIENTIDLMIQKGANLTSMQCVIGPCLLVDQFDVQNDFIDFLKEHTPFSVEDYLIKEDGSYKFNLVLYIKKRLRIKGLYNILFTNMDTYSHEDLFFSYRRKTHKNEPHFGVQLSAIGL